MIEDDLLIMLCGPTNVSTMVMSSMIKPTINHRGEEFHKLYLSLEEKLKKIFMTKNDVVIFTASGTGGVEATLLNLLKSGDKLILPIYGMFCQRAADTAQKFGIEVKACKIEFGSVPTLELVKKELDENPDARAVFIVYNETSTGVTVRGLKDICLEAKRRGVLTIVDAISILGGDHLPVDAWGIDACIAGAQKCLAVPPGVVLVSVSEEALQTARENRPKTTYFNIPLYIDWLRDRAETPFTPAVPLFYALDESLHLILTEGLEERFRRHERCASAIYAALEDMGLEVFPEEKCRSNVVIAVKYPPGVKDGEFRPLLKRGSGVEVSGGMGDMKGKVFRIGCMGEVSPPKVMRTILAISNTMNRLGFKNDASSAVEAALSHLSSDT
ncbi:MAG: pyridoxal-phosphate-dependent aminotransferase family protein [Candidatus Geothermarchaeales archaeon]